MTDDDGARCTRLTVFTMSWSRTYAPRGPADTMHMVSIERQDGGEVEPFGVSSLEDLGELIATIVPPLVSMRSAPGEDISALKRVVELATVTGETH